MPRIISGTDHDTGAMKDISSVTNIISNHTGILVDTDMLKNTFTEEYSADQSAVSIITPPSGRKLCIRSVEIITDANTGVVELDFVDSSKKVSRLYAAAQNRSVSNTAHIVGNIDEPLKLTTTTGAGKKVFLVITYVSHD